MYADDVPWYKAGLEEFNQRTGSPQAIASEILRQAGELGLDTCQSCVSVGVGTGDVDNQLFTKSFHNLQTFTAIEPNEEELHVFKSRLDVRQRPKLKVEFIPKRVEDWEGPKEPVDLVLLLDVLYHIPDKKLLFQQSLNWLNPGGTLVIFHGGEECCFVPIAKEFDVEDEHYTAKDVRSDLVALGVNFKESEIFIEFDISDRHPDVMNFLLQREATQAEFETLDKFLHKIMPTGNESQNGFLFWTKKI